MVQSRKILIWLLLAALAGAVGYFSFHAYLGPDFLLHFANGFYC